MSGQDHSPSSVSLSRQTLKRNWPWDALGRSSSGSDRVVFAHRAVHSPIQNQASHSQRITGNSQLCLCTPKVPIEGLEDPSRHPSQDRDTSFHSPSLPSPHTGAARLGNKQVCCASLSQWMKHVARALITSDQNNPPVDALGLIDVSALPRRGKAWVSPRG